MRVFYRACSGHHPLAPVVYEQTDVTFCCDTLCRCWDVLVGFGVKGCLRSTSREVGIFTSHAQANGKPVVGVMPVDFCPFCGEVIQTCRVK
jgi:hypothetical protein